MSESIWDSPDMRVGGDFMSFDKVGDSIAGTINAVRAHRFTDGSVAPQLLLTTDDGDEKTVTCGAIRLKIRVAELRPEPGDHVSIRLESEEPRGGGKTLRHWDVTVTRAGATPPAQAQAPTTAQAAPAQTQADPGQAAAALAALTPEQKAALGL